MNDPVDVGPSTSKESNDNKKEDSGAKAPVDGNVINVNNSEDEDEFYFESDHLALKNNKDYRALLKTLAILEAQRHRALKDIDTLVALKKQVKEDPVKFVEKLTDGSIKVPEPQVIPEIPTIDWSKYNIPISEIDKTVTDVTATNKSTSGNEDAKSKILVRGRVFDESKPETFNQLWTVEEQQRLEELLVKYPPEEVETNRWKKIAAELGNRTPKQVCSRVQKYFLKLQKAGLPVPGRPPKAHSQAEVTKRYPCQRKTMRPTTFFPNRDVPVPLVEPEEMLSSTASSSSALCESIPKTIMESGHERNEALDKFENIMSSRKLELLRKVLQLKEEGDFSNLRHVGTKCHYCEVDTIVGVLWTCVICPSVEFCTDCVVAQLDSPNPHPLSHTIIGVKEIGKRKVKTYDRDYFPLSFSEPGCSYNYLDPNFMPGDDG